MVWTRPRARLEWRVESVRDGEAPVEHPPTPPLTTGAQRPREGRDLTKAELNLRSQEKYVLDFKASPGVAFIVIRE